MRVNVKINDLKISIKEIIIIKRKFNNIINFFPKKFRTKNYKS